MPNLKIFVDEALGAKAQVCLHAALPQLREMICRRLDVELALTQCVLVPVVGLPDQAQLAVEIQILPKPGRSHEQLIATGKDLRNFLREVVPVTSAVRMTTVDPDNYLVIR
jgi:hypothetical protein